VFPAHDAVGRCTEIEWADRNRLTTMYTAVVMQLGDPDTKLHSGSLQSSWNPASSFLPVITAGVSSLPFPGSPTPRGDKPRGPKQVVDRPQDNREETHVRSKQFSEYSHLNKKRDPLGQYGERARPIGGK
jgi:hypothetical protein